MNTQSQLTAARFLGLKCDILVYLIFRAWLVLLQREQSIESGRVTAEQGEPSGGSPLANGSTVMISLLFPLPADVTATTQTLY